MRSADEPPASANGPARSRTARGVEGFFLAAPDDEGRWWLMDQQGAPFYFRGVHGVSAAGAQRDRELPIDSAGRLRRWGFNALGLGAERVRVHDDGLPFLASVGFCNGGPLLVAPGLRLPDVFDPRWPENVMIRAKNVCPALAGSRALVGWVTDDEVEWATPSPAGRPSFLQLCLSLEPAF